MQYEVEFYYVAQGNDGFVRVVRRLTLPFAPFVGLELWLGHDDNPVERVCWLAYEQRFVCEVKGDRGDEPLARLIEYAASIGFLPDGEPVFREVDPAVFAKPAFGR